MTYTFDPGSDVVSELREIARDQVDKAISNLTGPERDSVDAIHDARKRCKKLRGLVRLVRPALGEQYSIANTTFRDAARELSPLRDSHALLETFDALCDAQRQHLPASGLDGIRAELRRRAQQPSDDDRLATAIDLLRRGEASIDAWELDASGFDAFAGGLGKTYERGRKALQTAIESPTSENFHEYRKRVKYTWYHVRLLDEAAPATAGPFEALLHDLSDTLGDDHDLAVLTAELMDDPQAFGGDDEVAAAMVVVDGQRGDLQRRAVRAGVRLHAEKPKAFVRRFESYWDAWQTHGPELEVGEIGDLAPDR